MVISLIAPKRPSVEQAGEVWIEEHEGTDKARDLYGLQVDTCARVQSLGQRQTDQILLSRFPFDSARQALKGEELQRDRGALLSQSRVHTA
jgi:hypothetical protein